MSIMPAWAVKGLEWKREPLTINLIVGVEQMIHFPTNAQVGVPGLLANGTIFKHLFANETAYWQALQPFDQQRVKVKLEGSDELILLDVSAVTQQKPPKRLEPIAITLPQATLTEETKTAPTPQTKKPVKPSFFKLIRYATQRDNAPERLHNSPPQLRQVKVDKKHDYSALYHHHDADDLSLTLRDSFYLSGHYVTTIEVKNLSGRVIEFEPNRLAPTVTQGPHGVHQRFIATAMVYRDIGALGTKHDHTLIYVVTDDPFEKVVSY
jgi:integrating conjugative element protein (TIGR03749 family)